MTHPLPDGFTSRPATTDDAERVATLWNNRTEHVRGDRSSTPQRVLKMWVTRNSTFQPMVSLSSHRMGR